MDPIKASTVEERVSVLLKSKSANIKSESFFVTESEPNSNTENAEAPFTKRSTKRKKLADAMIKRFRGVRFLNTSLILTVITFIDVLSVANLHIKNLWNKKYLS